MLTSKQLLNELYQYDKTDRINLQIIHSGEFDVNLSLNVFEAMKLLYILPKKPNLFNYEKVS